MDENFKEDRARKETRDCGSGWFTKDIDSQRYPLVRLDRDEVVDGGSERGRWRKRRTWGWVGCAAASGPRIIGSYRGISANHVKSGRPLCAPRTSHRPKFPSPKLTTNTNAILSASPPSFPSPFSPSLSLSLSPPLPSPLTDHPPQRN